MFTALRVYLRALVRRRYPSLAPWAYLAPVAVALAAVWVALFIAIGFGRVLSTADGWSTADDVPESILIAVGISILLFLLSALGHARVRALAHLTGPGVLSARALGAGHRRAYLLQTGWVIAVTYLVLIGAMVGAVAIALAFGRFPPLAAGLGVAMMATSLLTVFLLRQGLTYLSVALSFSGAARRMALPTAVLAGGVAGVVISAGALNSLADLPQGIGAILYEFTIGKLADPSAADLVVIAGWIAAAVMVLVLDRVLLFHVTRATPVAEGRGRSRHFSGSALRVAIHGRFMGAVRAEPVFYALMVVPGFLLAALGAAAIHRAASGQYVTGVAGNMWVSLMPLVILTTFGRGLLPVTGANRFAGDLRGIYQSLGCSWRDEMVAGWLLHYGALLLVGLPLLIVVGKATPQSGDLPGIVAMYAGIAALVATVSVGTSVVWPVASNNVREVITGARGYLTEAVLTGVSTSLAALLVSTYPPRWALLAAGVLAGAAGWVGLTNLRRRGVGLWR